MSTTTEVNTSTEYILPKQASLNRLPTNGAEFMGIKLRHWPEDRIFDLLLKYKINGLETGIKFINNYLTTLSNPNPKTYKIMDKDLGIDLADMEINQNELFKKFIEGKDFVTQVEKYYTTNDMITALRKYYMENVRKQSTKTSPNQDILNGYPTTDKIYYYVTISGLLKAYQILDPANITEDMKTALNKLVMWSAVMTDTKNGENVYGTV